MRVSVYGRDLHIQRIDNRWRVTDIGNEGKMRAARDIRIPDGLAMSDLTLYLADLLHEHASERYPDVVIIEP